VRIPFASTPPAAFQTNGSCPTIQSSRRELPTWGGRSRSGLCWFSVIGGLAFPVSEYNAIFDGPASPIRANAQAGCGWTRRAADTGTGFEGNHVRWSQFTPGARAQNEASYEKGSIRPERSDTGESCGRRFRKIGRSADGYRRGRFQSRLGHRVPCLRPWSTSHQATSDRVGPFRKGDNHSYRGWQPSLASFGKRLATMRELLRHNLRMPDDQGGTLLSRKSPQ
jgi:hypothetical protein